MDGSIKNRHMPQKAGVGREEGTTVRLQWKNQVKLSSKTFIRSGPSYSLVSSSSELGTLLKALIHVYYLSGTTDFHFVHSEQNEIARPLAQ